MDAVPIVIWGAPALIAITVFFVGFLCGGISCAHYINTLWRRAAHEGKCRRIGQDIYKVEYLRSEPKEWI